jgi:uncharacterized protein (DUF488 family)
MTTIFTTGHSNFKLDYFIESLTEAGVNVLVDVRSRPQSRFCPWMNRASLSEALRLADIRYVWLGNKLGGLDGNTDHEGGLDQVLELAETGVTAVMCSERSADQKCHRRTKLTPEFQARGAVVKDIHILPNQPVTITDAPDMVTKNNTPVEESLFEF